MTAVHAGEQFVAEAGAAAQGGGANGSRGEGEGASQSDAAILANLDATFFFDESAGGAGSGGSGAGGTSSSAIRWHYCAACGTKTYADPGGGGAPVRLVPFALLQGTEYRRWPTPPQCRLFVAEGRGGGGPHVDPPSTDVLPRLEHDDFNGSMALSSVLLGATPTEQVGGHTLRYGPGALQTPLPAPPAGARGGRPSPPPPPLG